METCSNDADYFIKIKGLFSIFKNYRYVCSKCLPYICWEYYILNEFVEVYDGSEIKWWKPVCQI